MRIFLLVFGWGSIFGSVVDAAILLHAIWLAAFAGADWTMSVETHIREHLSLLTIFIDLAYAILPDGFARWVLGLPTVLIYPIRLVLSLLVGGWALRAARRMKDLRAI